MTYDLYIGARTYSSWSLRGWLMFAKFDLPVRVHMTDLFGSGLAQDLAPVAPARLVPAIRTPEGDPLQDTLAIAETLAERHPNAGLWPSDPSARILARWLVAEMHSGFTALRGACAMNLAHQWQGFDPSPEVLADLARIQQLWSLAKETYGQDGPWLFGDYTVVDAFYAPVAARIAGYDLPVNEMAQAYTQAHLTDLTFRQWRALAMTESFDTDPYPMPLDTGPWPGPAPFKAVPVDTGPAENDACPYSGKPVTHFLSIDGRTFGMCNPTCRDKTVNDPEAWPHFMAIYQS